MSALRALAALLVLAISFAAGAQNLGTLPFSGSSNLAAPGPIGGTTPAAGTFTSVTDTGLTAGRVNYNCTGGLLCDSANLTYDDTLIDLTVGTGTTTAAGVQIGYSGSSGLSGIWRTGVVRSNGNALLITDASQNVTVGGNVSTVNLYPQNSANSTNGISVSGGSIFSAVNAQVSLGKATNLFPKLYIDYTNTGTVGAVTINKAAGRVNIAAASQTVVVTNSFSTVAAHCFVNINSTTVDSTMTSVNCDTSTPGAITIRGNSPATTQRPVDFFIVNAD